MECKIEGCEKLGKLVRGYCNRCYTRLLERVNIEQAKWSDFDGYNINDVCAKRSYVIRSRNDRDKVRRRNLEIERLMIERIKQQVKGYIDNGE